MEPFLLALALALTPIYSFASGGIQYSHVVMALFMLIRLIRTYSSWNSSVTVLVALLALILMREAYGVVVEAVPVSALLEVVYITFALIVVITFSKIPLDSPGFTRGLKIGIATSAIVALAGMWYYGVSFIVSEGQIARAIGTFNNPNQLAYFAICVLSIGSLLYLRSRIGVIFYLLLIASAVVFAVSSLSKAGLLAVGATSVVAIAGILNRKRLSPKLLVFCAVVVGLVVLLYVNGVFDGFSFVQRLERIGSDSDDNLATRGYLLPAATETLRLLFGLGQAGVMRLLGHEVHSTFWSFLLKYGLVGFALFMYFWYSWTKQIWVRFGMLGVFLIVVPASFYGITHNGSRFAIFWILVGLSFAATAPDKLKQIPMTRKPTPKYPNLAAVNWQANPRA